MSEVPLRDFVEQIVNEKERRLDQSISALDHRMMQALADAEKAVNKAAAAQAHVNIVQNEWRGTVEDLTRKFSTKESVDRINDEMRRRLGDIEIQQSVFTAKADETKEFAAAQALDAQQRASRLALVVGVLVTGLSVALRYVGS